MKLIRTLYFILFILAIVSCNKTVLKVGDKYGGGIVGYIYGRGDKGFDEKVQHGIIVSEMDLSHLISWDSAHKLCENYNAGGFSDWKIPNDVELNILFTNKNQIGGFNYSDTSKNWTPSWVPTEIKKSVIDRNELLKLAGYPEYQNVSGYQYWSSTYYSKSDNQILKQDFKTGKVTYDIRAYERVYYCNVRAIRYF